MTKVVHKVTCHIDAMVICLAVEVQCIQISLVRQASPCDPGSESSILGSGRSSD